MGDEHWTAVSQEKIPKDPYADGRKTTAFFGKQQKTVNFMEIWIKNNFIEVLFCTL